MKALVVYSILTLICFLFTLTILLLLIIMSLGYWQTDSSLLLHLETEFNIEATNTGIHIFLNGFDGNWYMRKQFEKNFAISRFFSYTHLSENLNFECSLRNINTKFNQKNNHFPWLSLWKYCPPPVSAKPKVL